MPRTLFVIFASVLNILLSYDMCIFLGPACVRGYASMYTSKSIYERENNRFLGHYITGLLFTNILGRYLVWAEVCVKQVSKWPHKYVS